MRNPIQESKFFPNTRITYPSPYFPGKGVLAFTVPEDDDSENDDE